MATAIGVDPENRASRASSLSRARLYTTSQPSSVRTPRPRTSWCAWRVRVLNPSAFKSSTACPGAAEAGAPPGGSARAGSRLAFQIQIFTISPSAPMVMGGRSCDRSSGNRRAAWSG